MTRLSVRVPQDRVGAIIGPKGVAKRQLEKSTGTEIVIDSETGEIVVVGEDAPMAMKAQDWVRAVGRGFSPERAARLLREDVYLEVIDIRDYIGKSKKRKFEVRGRLIGRDGRARGVIEELSGASVSIMGNTVAVIGTVEENEIAHTALDMLLHGADHSQVYSFLEHRHRRARVEALIGKGPEDKPAPKKEEELELAEDEAITEQKTGGPPADEG